MFFIDCVLFLAGCIIHSLLLLSVISVFGYIFLSDFGLYFGEWFGYLFGGLICGLSNFAWIKHATFIRVVNHFHLLLFASDKFFEGHKGIVIEH